MALIKISYILQHWLLVGILPSLVLFLIVFEAHFNILAIYYHVLDISILFEAWFHVLIFTFHVNVLLDFFRSQVYVFIRVILFIVIFFIFIWIFLRFRFLVTGFFCLVIISICGLGTDRCRVFILACLRRFFISLVFLFGLFFSNHMR